MLDNILKYILNILTINIGNKKYRLQLLLKLNKLLLEDKQNNIVIQEIFKIYFNINLTSSQINNLAKDNNVIVIIEYLKKFPKILIYENKRLSYSRNNQYKINNTSNIVWYISSTFLSIITAISSYIAISESNIQQLIIAVTLIIYLVLMNNYRQDFKILEKLIESYE